MRREDRKKLAKPSWRMSGNIVDVRDLGGGKSSLSRRNRSWGKVNE